VAAEATAERPASAPRRRRLPLVALPVLLLGVVVAGVGLLGDRLTGLVGDNPPAADTFNVRRVAFDPGEIRILVQNPQPQDLTIAVVTIDDAIVPFTVDGPQTLGRLRSSTIVVPYAWVQDDPYLVGVTSSTGIQTTHEVAAAVPARGVDLDGVLGYLALGLLVGVVPVALGLGWLPSLRAADPRWIAAFMALTAGLLVFLAVDATAEALELQALLPAAAQGSGLILIGIAISALGLSWLSQRLTRGSGGSGGRPVGVALATLVAIGIGVHNMGEGLAIGTSFALGELALGSFLVIGFMVHNVTEGLGIAAPIAAAGQRASLARLAALTALAGVPAVLGAWIGAYLTNELLAVLFFGLAAGAALQVVVEVIRYLLRSAPGGLASGHVIGGFLAGLVAMYVTGLLI
jgi:zinc transporter ZupT